MKATSDRAMTRNHNRCPELGGTLVKSTTGFQHTPSHITAVGSPIQFALVQFALELAAAVSHVSVASAFVVGLKVTKRG